MTATVGTPWKPTVEWETGEVSQAAATRLHGLFGAPGSAPAPGDKLPPLWHWLAFLPHTRQEDLGEDGHPRGGGFLPSTSLPQRMFAGGRLVLHGRTRVGQLMMRRSEVAQVRETSGRSGPLCFVTVRHDLVAESGLMIVEEQDLVYRSPGIGPPREQPPDSRAWDWTWDLPIDPTLLFRFSALTYNAHRIHYDREYATIVEGHAGLVVHGPLQALAMLELVRRQRPDAQVEKFTFRAKRPVFDHGPLLIRGTLTDDHHVLLATLDHQHRLAMEADVVLRPTRGGS